MNKTLFSLVTLVTFGFASAQVKQKGTFEITPKIGYSSFSEINEGGSTDSNTGIEFGATADYYFNNRWSLRSGLIFDKMGGEYVFAGNKFEDKLNYLSIPINANWHFGSTRKWNLNFGLSPSFLVDAKVNDMEIPNGIIKSFQLGFTYGIGYKIEVTKTFGILLDFQGFAGLTNINEEVGNDFRNSGSSFNVGGVIEL